MKTAFAPHLGREIKFGRRRPVAIGPHFRMGRYLSNALPDPPSVCDYGAAAQLVLADVLGNDALGDCVIAGGYHIVGVETGNAGDLFHASSAQIINDYSAIGGYVPGNEATDQGADLPTAMNYWTQHGFANGTKLYGWLAVDGSNVKELMQACYLFENLYFGMALPDAWVNPFPSGDGFTWDVSGAPDNQNGHCVMGYGYTSSGIVIDTWALRGIMTWSAIAEYATAKSGGEVYTLLTPDQLAKAAIKAPNGLALAELIADFDAMGGHVPIPAPAPAPTPAPSPSPSPAPTPTIVTLAQAQAWANAGLARGATVMTRSRAEKLAAAGLAASWPKP